jgi:Meiotically up-regulated gene 113
VGLTIFFLVIISFGALVAWSGERTRRKQAEAYAAQTLAEARQVYQVGSGQLQDQHARLSQSSNFADELSRRLAEATANAKRLEGERRDAQQRGQVVAAKYIGDANEWLISRLTQNNLETSRNRSAKIVAFCAKHGFELDKASLSSLDADIVAAFRDAVRKDLTRQEQQRIKEQMREEQRAAREYARAEEQASREEAAVRKALTTALQKADAEHSAEVASLRSQLEALAEKKRALSMAQQTRTGHVYVISNIGSFGDGVFKVGMTRRLEPQERIDELSGAAVPFPFDVHMMISTADAPALENALHREFHSQRLNKVNLRKEFFRVSLDQIAAVVKRKHGHVDYRATPDAFEFHETGAIVERGQLALVPEYVEPLLEDQLEDA